MMMIKTAALIFMIVGLFACAGNKREIRAPGVVDGEIATIKALTAGTLERLLAEEGQAVKKGQRLVELERDKLRNALEALALGEMEIANNEARAREKRPLLAANQAYWQKQVQRFERLKENRSVSGDQLERSRLQLREAQTALLELERSLAALRIQLERIANQRRALELNEADLLLDSPVSGVVLETFIGPGETVLPGAPLADILDLSSLFVDVFIEEREIAALKIGQQAAIFVDGMDGRSFAGRIAAFGRKAEFSPKYIVAEKERQALLYQVKVRIDRDLDVFKVGQPVTVVFSR
jgi:multidrug resistance efflux pump